MGLKEKSPSEFRNQLETIGVDLHDNDTAGRLDLGRNLNLNAIAIALGLESIEYEPEVFPALVYHMDEFELTLIVYGDGQLATVDAPDEETARRAFETVGSRLVEVGVLDDESTVGGGTVPANRIPAPEAVESKAGAVETVPTVARYSLTYDDIERGEPIGSGGNADVYYASADTDSEAVELALKEPRLSGTLHTETIERMLEEAETWQRLDDHDHIVTVVNYGSEPLPWIAMEYMDAGHLGERAGELELDQALWTAVATTKAVRHAHRRGVAHLDLKPENVLFRSVDGHWDVPKVADWGLSQHLLEHSKSIDGLSPHYAAPEQFEEDRASADDITDIYQLGAVFYELFTGRPPFEGRPVTVMNKTLSEEPTPPSEFCDLPAELDDILLRALATEKGERYETVVNLRDDLQDI